MMEELENKTVVDPFSEEAIIASLPLEAQGELKAYGAMENKTVEELHTILLQMREKYDIPPNHPFTYLMKLHGGSAILERSTSENAWATRTFLRKSDFDTKAVCGEHKWRRLTVTRRMIAGDTVAVDLYVNMADKQLWGCASECLLRGSTITVYSKTLRRQSSVSFRQLYNKLESLKRTGEIPDVIEIPLMTSKEVTDVARACRRDIKMHKWATIKEAETQDNETTTPANLSIKGSSMSPELLIPMFELAKAKALELGMTETIKLWEEALHV